MTVLSNPRLLCCREDVFTSMLPVYHKLLAAKLEMLVRCLSCLSMCGL
jgi:hypothetical protein